MQTAIVSKHAMWLSGHRVGVYKPSVRITITHLHASCDRKHSLALFTPLILTQHRGYI